MALSQLANNYSSAYSDGGNFYRRTGAISVGARDHFELANGGQLRVDFPTDGIPFVFFRDDELASEIVKLMFEGINTK